jgi:hypothetical protein
LARKLFVREVQEVAQLMECINNIYIIHICIYAHTYIYTHIFAYRYTHKKTKHVHANICIYVSISIPIPEITTDLFLFRSVPLLFKTTIFSVFSNISKPNILIVFSITVYKGPDNIWLIKPGWRRIRCINVCMKDLVISLWSICYNNNDDVYLNKTTKYYEQLFPKNENHPKIHT